MGKLVFYYYNENDKHEICGNDGVIFVNGRKSSDTIINEIINHPHTKFLAKRNNNIIYFTVCTYIDRLTTARPITNKIKVTF